MGIEIVIRQYLEDHGIKQTFVSDQCGWTKQKTNAIVTGKRRITADEYGAICEAVGVPYDYFYNLVAATRNSA